MDPLGFLQSFMGGGGTSSQGGGSAPLSPQVMLYLLAGMGLLGAIEGAGKLAKMSAPGGSPMGPGQLPPMGRMAQGQPQGGMPPGVGPSMG